MPTPANAASHEWTRDVLEQLNVSGPATFTGLVTATGGVTGNTSTTVAASAAINSTETLLLNIPLVAGQTLRVGSKVRITLEGTCTSTNADVSTFTIRAGILGTKADASVATAAVTSSGSGTAQPFKVVLEFTVRTLGASGTAAGTMVVLSTGAATGVSTGIQAFPVTVVAFTSATLATTTATFLDVTYVAAAVTTTCTFQDVSIEIYS